MTILHISWLCIVHNDNINTTTTTIIIIIIIIIISSVSIIITIISIYIIVASARRESADGRVGDKMHIYIYIHILYNN